MRASFEGTVKDEQAALLWPRRKCTLAINAAGAGRTSEAIVGLHVNESLNKNNHMQSAHHDMV
jgi:hypothetical protein